MKRQVWPCLFFIETCGTPAASVRETFLCAKHELCTSMHPAHLSIADFTYDLPQNRIARYPLPRRDASRLLVYQAGSIHENTFRNLAEELPADSLLFFNETKVIQARLLFQKTTGGVIQTFLLNPADADMSTALAEKEATVWHCLIGGASKWKPGYVPEIITDDFVLQARIMGRNSEYFTVAFSWNNPAFCFGEVLEKTGHVPLPPYLHRSDEPEDKTRYQSLLASQEGSVAAPTASLHFSEDVLASLKEKGIGFEKLVLHVGAGTFRPVSSEKMEGHQMHAEWLEVDKKVLKNLMARLGGKKIIAVGTTALRSLESLYWMGCKAAQNPDIVPQEIKISQWEPYDGNIEALPATEALAALLQWLEKNGLEKLATETGILLAPPYEFKIADALITNFHQPQSTLLLLVAAFIGEDWKRVYDYALAHDFRFLSYGDGSLLFRDEG